MQQDNSRAILKGLLLVGMMLALIGSVNLTSNLLTMPHVVTVSATMASVHPKTPLPLIIRHATARPDSGMFPRWHSMGRTMADELQRLE